MLGFSAKRFGFSMKQGLSYWGSEGHLKYWGLADFDLLRHEGYSKRGLVIDANQCDANISNQCFRAFAATLFSRCVVERCDLDVLLIVEGETDNVLILII
jgi:hypothetical protein